jgi:hypothetical protein
MAEQSHEEWVREAKKATRERQKETKVAEKVAEEETKTTRKRNKIVFKELLKSSKTATAIQQQASQAVSTVSTHVREVLGPVQELVDFTKATFKNIGDFFKGVFEDVKEFFGWTLGDDTDDKIHKESVKQTHFLKRIWQYFLEQRTKEFRRDIKKTKEKFPTSMLVALGILGWLGFVLGGILRQILLPFEVLLKLPLLRKLKQLKWIKRLTGFFDDILRWLEKIPLLGRLVKGVRIGFKWLGWPLQILLSLIDFIRGYSASEGDILDKIKAGILFALTQFFELPIRVFGWLMKKLGWETATEDTLIAVKSAFGKILDIIFYPFRWIYDTLSAVSFKEGVIDPIKIILDNIKNFFTEFFTRIYTSLKEVFEKSPLLHPVKYLKEKFGGAVDWLTGGSDADADPKRAPSRLGIPEMTKGVDVSPHLDMAAEDLAKGRGIFLKSKVEREIEWAKALADLKKSVESVDKTQAEAGGNIVTAVNQGNVQETKEPVSGMEEAATMWLNLAM